VTPVTTRPFALLAVLATACASADGGVSPGGDSTGPCQSDVECDDGVFCNGAEVCRAGTCAEGAPVVCDDGVECTVDSCDAQRDGCVGAPDDSACSDGLGCNGAEACDVALGCQAGAPVDCDDGVACTTDTCLEMDGSCQNVPDHASCGEGMWCDPKDGCGSGHSCDADADCDDGFHCNGAEPCVEGFCIAGPPVSCGEGVDCTVDACNEASDSCNHVASDARCDDGLWCTGEETCDALLDCQSAEVPSCDDAVGCTTDRCDEDLNRCVSTVDHGRCDDGLACNGTETCSAASDCLAGEPVRCDDGVSCTNDACLEPTGECASTPDDRLCGAGEICNVVDDCTVDCDADGDGVQSVGCGGADCNDGDPAIHPGAVDTLEEADWAVETIDDGVADDSVTYTNLAIAPGGAVHVSYAHHHLGSLSKLRHATDASGAWEVEVVRNNPDGFGAFDNDIAVDADGAVHMTWIENGIFGDSPWMYGTNASGAWVFTELERSDMSGYWNAIALDADGNAHVAGYTTSALAVRNDVQYLTNESGAWVMDDVSGDAIDDGQTPDQIEIAIDDGGAAHVCWQLDGTDDLVYATNESGAWASETVDSTGATGLECDIAVGADGVVHISYRDDTLDDLRYAEGNAGSWTKTTVDAAGISAYTSLALDADGHAHIAYQRAGLRHATNESGAWRTEAVDATGGAHSGIAVDGDGGVHVSFARGDDDLGYACLAPPTGDGIDQDCDGEDG
jgi:hypothetical protein